LRDRRFAAAGRADDGGDGVLTEIHGGVLDGVVFAKIYVQAFELDFCFHQNLYSLRYAGQIRNPLILKTLESKITSPEMTIQPI
jgi:hypothetical protein